MIFVRKTILASQSLLLFPLQRYFSDQMTKLHSLSNSAQQAVWATHIIKVITDEKAKLPQTFNDESLREKIIKLPLPSACNVYSFDPANKQQVIKIFTEGIVLDEFVYRQTRITDAQSNQQDNRVIFCPNYLVTPRVFRILLEQNRNCIIYGGYGISKTFSIILYIYLTQFCSKYWIEASKDKIKTDEKKKLIQQKLLGNQCQKILYWSIDDDIINSIDTKSEENIQLIKNNYFKQLFLMQAPELTKEQKLKLESIQKYENFVSELKYFFLHADIQLKAVIDQINAVAQVFRKWNKVYYSRIQQENEIKLEKKKLKLDFDKSLAQVQSRRTKQKIQKQYNEKLEALKTRQRQSNQLFLQPLNQQPYLVGLKMLKLIQLMKDLSFKYVFNSSLNIQYQLLHRREQNTPLYHLTLSVSGYHREFQQHYIKFQENLTSKQGSADFYHFFWFELEKQLEKKQISPKIIEEIKNILGNIIDQKKFSLQTYYRLLFIRQFFAVKWPKRTQPTPVQWNDIRNKLMELYKSIEQLLESFNKDKKKQVFEQNIPKLILLFSKYCINKSTINIIKFIISKESPEVIQIKKKFIKLVYKLATLLKKQNKTKMCFFYSDFSRIFSIHLSEIFFSKENNTEFLPINLSRNTNYIQFLWTPEQFITITEPIVHEKIDTFESQFWSLAERQYYFKNRQTFDINFLRSLIEAMSQKATIKFQVYKHFSGKQLEEISPTMKRKSKLVYNSNNFEKIQFQIDKVQTFTSFNNNLTNNEDQGKLINFQTILKIAKQQPSLIVLGFPTKVYMRLQSKYKEHNKTSQNIDFLLAEYSSENQKQKYRLFSFYVLTSLKGIKTKMKQAGIMLKQIAELYRKRCVDIEFHHIIVCPRETCQMPTSFSDFPELQISCCSIEQIEILSCQSQHKLLNFVLLQKLSKQLTKEDKKQDKSNKQLKKIMEKL